MKERSDTPCNPAIEVEASRTQSPVQSQPTQSTVLATQAATVDLTNQDHMVALRFHEGRRKDGQTSTAVPTMERRCPNDDGNSSCHHHCPHHGCLSALKGGHYTSSGPENYNRGGRWDLRSDGDGDARSFVQAGSQAFGSRWDGGRRSHQASTEATWGDKAGGYLDSASTRDGCYQADPRVMHCDLRAETERW